METVECSYTRTDEEEDSLQRSNKRMRFGGQKGEQQPVEMEMCAEERPMGSFID